MQRLGNYRDLFSGIEIPVRLADGSFKIPINFDNGATTPPFKYVDTVLRDSIGMYGAIHRGGQKALHSTQLYEETRLKILDFVGLSHTDGYCVIYVKNTTEGINLLADELCSQRGAKVLTTRMEHHANDLPWRRNANVFYVEVDEKGQLKLEEFERILRHGQGTIQYVSVTGASNVTGHVTPIHEVAQVAHHYGAKIIVDAAQLIAHQVIDMKGKHKGEEIDFLVFSAHKMYAPFGTGVIVARQELLEEKAPHLLGGGAVRAVLDYDVYFKHSPDKEEAGTPNFLGVMALSAAIDMMNKIGMHQVWSHEQVLKKQMIEGLRSIPKVRLYGDSQCHKRLGAIPFNIEGTHHSVVADILANEGAIAVREGCFCAHPYVSRLLGVTEQVRYEAMLHPERKQPGMIRASLGLYNTENEVDEFLEWIAWIAKK
ncbi:MAG: aminotransferase class V-fold PLP-dependent enzyme [Cellulosilyticaceae bacterium]